MASRSRPKMEFAGGKLTTDQQELMPRFRRGAGARIEYCFAFPFKSAPHWLVILPGPSSWGTVRAGTFLHEWMPSNGEARAAIGRHLVRFPKTDDDE